jgi:hypothetical protein
VEKELVGDTELKLEDVLKDKNFTIIIFVCFIEAPVLGKCNYGRL